MNNCSILYFFKNDKDRSFILEKLLLNCSLCPRNCRVNRQNGEVGFCGARKNPKVARSALHFWEEPCISGKNGSGTVFFSNCTLQCVFCQNRLISADGVGEDIDTNRLASLFLDLQSQGALNINLVTPTHYIVPIIKALDTAKSRGLVIPVVYNTSGYEKADIIKLLKGYVDIFLPDFKYYNDKFSIKYSNAPDYFLYASSAVEEMVNQTGSAKFDDNGNIVSGTIVRHLMLPGLLFDSKKVLDYLYNTYGNDIYISIMNQYTPVGKISEHPELNRKISWDYYNTLIDYALKIGIENAYIQDKDTASESFIPEFYNKL